MTTVLKVKKPLKTLASTSFSFDTPVLVKQLLSASPERARAVIVQRFGLGTNSKLETLESIGSREHITRERVRQIEAAGLDAIRSSKVFKESSIALDEIASFIQSLGTLVSESSLLDALAKDEKGRNRFRFLLIIGSMFVRERETDDFLARWHVDAATAKKIHTALSRLYESLSDDNIVSEGQILSRFLDELKDINDAYKNEEILKRWLALSKRIGKNPLSEWGRANSPSIRTKSIRDYAYLAIKRHGKPMHFFDVAKTITAVFAKKAHVATTHNELIKDARFVLVGRGLYALSEWGYTPGIVRNVIQSIIKKQGPMTKEEIIAHVKRARFVKDNTILVNLNDTRYFKRLKDGRYVAA